MKVQFSLLLPVLLPVIAFQAARAQSADSTKDKQAIRQLVQHYEDAWNRHDPAGLAANYTPNATWVNWFGAYYIGRQDIEDHYKSTHEGYFKNTHYYTRSIEDIIFVKPDVAISHVRTGLSGDSRYPGQVFEFRRMIVLTKQAGVWLILAGQNAKLEEPVKAGAGNNPPSAPVDKKDEYNKMLEYSHPGAQHLALGAIAGRWTFQDAKLAFVKGTLERKPIFDGRFYSVEITGGKLPLPVADGRMKEDFYRELQTEGYDNGRGEYVTSSVNNHIGSDIQLQMGAYDAATKTFTYYWESELIKGVKVKNKRTIHIVDNDTYVEEFFEETNGQYIKVRELDYKKAAN